MRVSILVENDSAPKFVRGGWAKVLKYCGHNVEIFDPRRESVHDHFRRCEPEIYLGTTYGVDRATRKVLDARPKTKVGLFGSCFGPITDNLDREKYPLDVRTPEESMNVANLSNYTAVFIHHTPKTVEHKTMTHWRGISDNVGSVINGSDIFSFLNGIPQEKYACDIAFVGGYWPYKARNLDKTIVQLCNNKELNIKIFGNGKWSVAQYAGFIEESEMKHLFASAVVCLNVSEPHSTDLGFDIIERVFKVPTCNGLLVSDTVNEFDEIINSETLIPQYRNSDDIIRFIELFKENPKLRIEYIQDQKMWVLDGHTYFHRVADIWNLLNEPEQAEESLKKYTELRKQHGI